MGEIRCPKQERRALDPNLGRESGRKEAAEHRSTDRALALPSPAGRRVVLKLTMWQSVLWAFVGTWENSDSTRSASPGLVACNDGSRENGDDKCTGKEGLPAVVVGATERPNRASMTGASSDRVVHKAAAVHARKLPQSQELGFELGAGWIMVMFFGLMVVPVESVVCPICKDCIPGCTGGEACPLATELAGNVQIFEAGTLGTTPTVTHSLPATMRAVFTPALCEALVGICTAPAGGTSVDLSDTTLYPTPTSVVRAARYGHCTIEEGVMELSERTAEADVDDMSRIKAAVEMVKAVGGNSLSGIQGVYSFIWAKTGQLVARATESIRLTTSTVSSRLSAADLAVNLKRPASEAEFFERLHYYVMLLAVLGLVHVSVIMTFIKEAVFDVKRRLSLSWQVCHELFVLYLDRIETDVTRALHFGNILERGMFDTMLTQAKANEVICFRTRGENPRAGAPTNVSWNGKYTSTSKQPCMAYNKGTEHTSGSLDADGTCRFNHVCMQWVDDKGPRGICGGAHPKGECTYDAKHKLDGPRK